MRAVITAGGTAGHINPAIAIANEIVHNEPDSEILFIGRKEGMERKLVGDAGYRLEEIEIHGFMRRITVKNILFNIKSAFGVLSAQREAKRIVKAFAPDIVIGCGGYVSGPVVRIAAKSGYKTAIQEQNSFPGITTKLLAKHVDRIFAADDSAVKRIGFPDKSVVTGNPIRSEFFTANRKAAREKWEIGDRVVVLSYGGSNGARGLNEAAAAFMARHWKSDDIFHIHATGSYTKDSFPELLKSRGVDLGQAKNIRIFEYIDDMPAFYAMSDLILCRAGALTISEIEAAGKASVLIPSPNVTENHQFYNAMQLAEAGAAFVYEEKDLDVEALADRMMELCKDPAYLTKMGEKAKALSTPDAAKRIYSEIAALLSA